MGEFVMIESNPRRDRELSETRIYKMNVNITDESSVTADSG